MMVGAGLALLGAVEQVYEHVRQTWPTATGYVLMGAGLATFVLGAIGRPVPDACLCACGYDLTGNASGVCPECGTPVKPVGEGKP